MKTLGEDHPRPINTDFTSHDHDVAALAWYRSSRYSLFDGVLRDTAAHDLKRASAHAPHVRDVTLVNDIARAQVFVTCEALRCRLRSDNRLRDYLMTVNGLPDQVVALLANPQLVDDPLGRTLIAIDFGEITIPYVNAALTERAEQELGEEGRKRLLGALRQSEVLLIEYACPTEKHFDSAATAEIVQRRRSNALRRIQGLLRLIADPLSWP